MIRSARKQYYLGFEPFRNLNQCIFNENTLKWWVWSTRNASWIISNMAASTTCGRNVCIFSVKEYEIITTEKHAGKIYYFFACTKMQFSKPSKLAFWSWSTNVSKYELVNSISWFRSNCSFFFLLTIYNYKLLKAFPQSICKEFISPVGYFLEKTAMGLPGWCNITQWSS